jgi:hypothetical protein
MDPALADRLDLPLRERNALLLAAGFARSIPSARSKIRAEAVQRAVRVVLSGHEPIPRSRSIATGTLVAANDAVAPLLAGVAPALLAPPINVMRLSLNGRARPASSTNLARGAGTRSSGMSARSPRRAIRLGRPAGEIRTYPAPPAGGRRSDDFGGRGVPLQTATSAACFVLQHHHRCSAPARRDGRRAAIEAFFRGRATPPRFR